MTVLPCPMTFEQMKTIALQVLEDRLGNLYGLHTGGSFGVEIDSKEKWEILDGIAHDIAGRIDRESM